MLRLTALGKPRPAISTGRSMTDTGGTLALRLAGAAGPIAVPTLGGIWFVLYPVPRDSPVPP